MKTIVMYEGGQEHVFTAAKLRTPLQSGGTCDWVPEDETDLVTKYVSENGTYNASSDNAYGYSQFSVNVKGGNGSSNNSGKPAGSDVTTTKPGGGLDLDGITPPGGSGSSVVGTDPETGNDVAVGVDSNGNLVQTPVPSAIQIITPPTKTAYTYQETMDYTGIVVAAKKKDGTTFTDARYTNGHIPMQELIFPVETAPAASGSRGKADSETSTVFAQPIAVGLTGYEVNYTDHPTMTGVEVRVTSDSGYVCHSYILNGTLTFLCASKTSSTVGVYNVLKYKDGTSEEARPNYYRGTSVTYKGKTFYYQKEISSFDIGERGTPVGTPETISSAPTVADAYVMLFGDDEGGTATIPVKWTNPYTGATQQDTFEITSTPADGDAHTSTGSSGGGSF